MYKITGADGKEYGPVNLDQLRQWVAEGRITPQTRVKPEGTTDWRTALEIPEVAALLAARTSAPGPMAAAAPTPTQAQGQRTGMAIASLVLGIPSVFLCFLFTGIPAVIFGHIALSRSKRSPTLYGGAGMAIAGLVLGYLGILMSVVIFPAMLLPAFAKAKARAEMIGCKDHLSRIGEVYQAVLMDKNNVYPFNVSTNSGGTQELASREADGFDRNSYAQLKAMSDLLKEKGGPRILVCPADNSKTAAASWETVGPANVTYLVHLLPNDAGPDSVLVLCPIHGTALLADGSIRSPEKSKGD
ncbi:MAG: hypothetical protein C5B50_16630 [Verrucomicrobia bacterium]|nr:MAG: hypothetical protein C5B50_16630 [Verrucomicrobiota bacterium]